MLAVAVARGPGEHRDDYMRAERAHDRDDVAEQLLPGPMLVCVGRILREAEIIRAGEVLPGAIDPARRDELLGAHDAERFAQLVADEILSSIAPRQREVRGLDMPAARQP